MLLHVPTRFTSKSNDWYIWVVFFVFVFLQFNEHNLLTSYIFKYVRWKRKHSYYCFWKDVTKVKLFWWMFDDISKVAIQCHNVYVVHWSACELDSSRILLDLTISVIVNTPCTNIILYTTWIGYTQKLWQVL